VIFITHVYTRLDGSHIQDSYTVDFTTKIDEGFELCLLRVFQSIEQHMSSRKCY
jgi:hypothetical protein